jgi:hypothetical protein
MDEDMGQVKGGVVCASFRLLAILGCGDSEEVSEEGGVSTEYGTVDAI